MHIPVVNQCQTQGQTTVTDSKRRNNVEKLVQVALKTPPKPQKMMGYKGVPAQRKKPRKQKAA
jgi:hypothetical protein